MRNLPLIFGLVFLAAVAGYLYLNQEQPQKQSEPVAVEPIIETSPKPIERKEPVIEVEPTLTEPEVVAVSKPAIVLHAQKAQTLDDSDAAAADVMRELNPSLLQWFTEEGQLRKLILAVDRLAEGELPNVHLPLQYQRTAFVVNEIDAASSAQTKVYSVAAQNDQRFTPLISALKVIPSDLLVAYYHDWLPLLEQAQEELGQQQSFDERLKQAFKQILQAKPLPANTHLVQPHVLYRYQDADMEAANGVQKFLWRIGNANAATLQAYIKELQSQL